jgi:hypothetical protein
VSRFNYVKYDDKSAGEQLQFKEVFEAAERIISNYNEGRSKALALTSLEEAYMWIGKMIRDQQFHRNGVIQLQERN